jgi:DNA-binding winged helix-turn-helix (wHTH) protein/TolB-like protein/Flp pilus assembly protein TadD
MQVYRFGEFELDLDAFELKLPGKPVKLERRALDLLSLLVKQPNRMVPREEIIAALWPPNVVIDFDAGLNTLVRKVRTALGDSSDSPRYIETVPGRGYRFIAPVVTLSESPPQAQTEASPAMPPTPPRRWRIVAAAVALLALAAVVTTWLVDDEKTGPMRIAVLPFDNLTGDADLAYLASGLAEETAYALARLQGRDLRVVNVPVSVIGGSGSSIHNLDEKLGLDLAVLSSVRVEGERIRVTSRLVRVADGEELWTAGIDRALTNVLGVQRELSTAIAEQIRLRLAPEVAKAIALRQTRNPQAYALYLKGRHEWRKLTPPGARRAIEYYEQATKLDPDYALAWAGLAWGAITSVRTADASPLVATPQAKRALDEALRLGPDLAETHIALGYYHLFHDLDRQAAIDAARRAIELDPNSGYAHQLLGASLMGLNQHVEALEMMRRTRELEPMFTLAFANSANVALSAGDVPGATEFARQAIAIDPEFWLGHYYLGRCLAQSGEREAALREFEDAARLSDGHSLTFHPRASILLAKGRDVEARALIEEATERARTGYFPPFVLAQLEVSIGNTEAAFAQLERAIKVQDVNLLGLSVDPSLAPLRKDPRFAQLVERCNCSPKSASGR